jgi:hypothetical protein
LPQASSAPCLNQLGGIGNEERIAFAEAALIPSNQAFKVSDRRTKASSLNSPLSQERSRESHKLRQDIGSR